MEFSSTFIESLLKEGVSADAVQTVQRLQLAPSDLSHLPYSALKDEGVSLRDYARIRKVISSSSSLLSVALLHSKEVDGVLPTTVKSVLSRHDELRLFHVAIPLTPLTLEEYYRCDGVVLVLDKALFLPAYKQVLRLVMSALDRSRWVIPIYVDRKDELREVDDAGIVLTLARSGEIQWRSSEGEKAMEELEQTVAERLSSFAAQSSGEMAMKVHAVERAQSRTSGSLLTAYKSLLHFLSLDHHQSFLSEAGREALQAFNVLGRDKELFAAQQGVEMVRNSPITSTLLLDVADSVRNGNLFTDGTNSPSYLAAVLTCLWVLLREETNKKKAFDRDFVSTLSVLFDIIDISYRSSLSNEQEGISSADDAHIAEMRDTILSESLICLQNYSHSFLRATEDVGERGLVQRVVDFLDRFRQNDRIVSHCLGCLWCLTAAEDNKRRISSGSGSKIMVEVMYEKIGNAEIMAKGFAAVWNLSLDVELKRAMHNEKIERLICSSIKQHPNDTVLLAKAFGALWNMTVRPDDRRTAVEEGAIDLCLDVAQRYFSDKVVLAQVIGALKNITCDQGENKRAIADRGGVPLILDIISRYPQDLNILVQAMGSIWNLSGITPNKSLIVEEGGLELVLDTLARYLDQEVLCGKCLATLWNISSQESLRPRVGRSVAPKLICESLRRHRGNHSIVVKALASLWNTSSTDENKAAIARYGAIEAISDALHRFRQSEDVVVKCLATFWNLSSVQEYKSLIAKHEGVPRIIETMRLFPRHRVILVKALASLWNLSCDHHDNKHLIYASEGVMVICDVVNANLDLEDVVLKAWGALHNLASEDYVKEQLITLSAISLVRRTLKQHPAAGEYSFAYETAVEGCTYTGRERKSRNSTCLLLQPSPHWAHLNKQDG
eukprot:CAMPEP_0113870284 /NCGR_PEP_ID=MMETSP0780_2-20120614/2002_1 /TAXON_ID=652834 /ORGANISM="Palpitomonas bilix" /LENGTH=894 /DNA_ID=CAMNT_0000855547 /DNA_START=183 /DNA_END=2868 /DNA_ORIENTATION=- /assembly_acc=CAM_ASM_000599